MCVCSGDDTANKLSHVKLLSHDFNENRRRIRNLFSTNNNNIKQENTILKLARSRLPENQKAMYAGDVTYKTDGKLLSLNSHFQPAQSLC